jgi:phage protein D
MSETSNLTPACLITVDGSRLDTAHEGSLASVTIHDRLNGVSTCSLVFNSAEAKLLDKSAFSLESELLIKLGYKDALEEVFAGDVVGLKVMLSEWDGEQLEISGASALHRLCHGARVRHFEKKALSERVKGIITGYSLKAELDSFGAASDFAAQAGESDYDYLLRAAALYGKQVFANGATIFIKDEVTPRSDEIIYEWGKNLISLEATQDLRRLLSRVDCVGWDAQKGAAFNGSAALSDLAVKVGGSKDFTVLCKGGGAWTETRVDLSLKDRDEAKSQAKGILQSNSFLLSAATGSGEGNPKLRPGMRVTLKNVGKAFEGEYMADAVTHRLSESDGYTTSFTLKRNKCGG